MRTGQCNKINIMLLGATGFIGANLIIELAKNSKNNITAVGRNKKIQKYFGEKPFKNVKFLTLDLTTDSNYKLLVKNQEVVYHLLSTTIPATSNRAIAQELNVNIILSINLFEACVYNKVKKVIFLSSGGAVYGKEVKCPINEEALTKPINSYGIQKITIEKLLYLYNFMYGLDYNIIRLSNPYGPYQKPNGVLGAVSTFTYKALKGEEIQVYGDGSVVRDFIYIDDAIKGILKIANGTDTHHTFNLGCGYGTSINQVLDTISKSLKVNMNIRYLQARKIDVPINYLNIKRYEQAYGTLNPISLEEGVKKTASFLKRFYTL